MYHKKILVTGGNGFIGSHIVDFLLGANFEVIVVDDLSTGEASNLQRHANLGIYRTCLLDKLPEEKFIGVTCIMHFAANADIRDGMKHSEKDIEQNILATERVARLAINIGVKDIIFASTAAVMGEPDTFPTPETVAIKRQTSLYGMSKLAAEGILSAYSLNYGLRVSVFRFVSIVGPRYSHGHIIDFVNKLNKNSNSLEILGDGQQRKSYLHVSDLIEAIRLVLLTHSEETESFFEIYNVGNDEYCTVTESAKVICSALRVSPELCYAGGLRGWVGDSPFVHLDTAKLKGLGWKPKVQIFDAIRSTAFSLIESKS